MNNIEWFCSFCGSSCGNDGRMGDGPYLSCDCRKNPRWVDDGKGGGYWVEAKPVPRSKEWK